MNVKRNGTKKFTNALHFVLDCEIILNNTLTDLLWKIIQDPNENFMVLKHDDTDLLFLGLQEPL